MWHAPNQRIRSLTSGKKRDKDKGRKSLHIKRVTAQLEFYEGDSPDPTSTHVRLVLNDLTAKSTELFSPIALNPGQEIALSIKEPERVKVQAQVVWCQEQGVNSHILSNQPYSFRLCVEFKLTPEEAQAMAAFCEIINNNYLFNTHTI